MRAEFQSLGSPSCTFLRWTASLGSAARRRNLPVLALRAALKRSPSGKLPEPERAAG